MTKDEEQMIANLMHRMHANEQARIESALATARMDAVTRAEADRVRIEALSEDLRKEREAHAETADLLNKADAKVRNMEHAHSVVLSRITRERDSLKDMLDRQTPACNKLILEGHELRAERDALRAEVADLRGIVDMVHASLGIKRGDHIGNAIAQLKAQTPKRSHPVAVGEYLRRLTGFSTTPAGEVAQVLHVACGQYTVKRPNGQQGVWFESGCEPCDPPATHDTEAGKAAAEAALKSESVTDIKVGDLCEVFQATTRTLKTDIGITGRVSSVHLDPCHGGFLVKFDPSTQSRRSTGMQAFGLCDVRKVTT